MPKETKTETVVEAIPYELDLDAALEDVLSEARTDEVPDVLHHQDYRERWPTDRKELIAALATKSYNGYPSGRLPDRQELSSDLGSRGAEQAAHHDDP